MRHADLRKSTAFRLAMTFSLLFLASYSVAGALAFSFIRSGFDKRLDQTVQDTAAIIGQSFSEGDIEDLATTVQRYADISKDHEAVFFLAGPTGKRLAGNVETVPLTSHLSDSSGAAFGLESERDYRSIKVNLGPNTLVVAMSYSDTDRLGMTALESFAWAGILAFAVAIAAGIFLAGTVQSRLAAIGATMARVGQGDLTARIPHHGADDDVDRLGAQVNAALDRLGAQIESVRQVSVDIAHDLRTPLNRLSMTIEVASRKAEAGADNGSELAMAQEEMRRLDDTFDAMLRIAQLEAGARRERFVDISLAAVLDVLADTYSEVALENNQTLIYRPHAFEHLRLKGDWDLLTQLFANLLENAIRHAGPGTIELSLTRQPGRLTVCVADDGPGIPTEERERLFQRLYRLDKSRSTPGTGLGLSMVKAIADLHHASVSLGDHHPGLEVSVSFPIADNRGSAQASRLTFL